MMEDEEKSKLTELDYYESLSEEEKIKELNLFTEQRRQESLAKYGRDIYAEDREIGDKKAIKNRDIIDKLLDYFYIIKYIIVFVILIFILVKVWSKIIF